jgi:hypothetical protein
VRARQARRVLRGDALFDVGVAAFLLLAGWHGLYRALGLPVVRPAIFAELAGVLLLGFAYLLWIAPDYSVLSRRVAEASAIGNGASAALIALWLASGPAGIRPLGVVLMFLVTAALAVFAGLEARIASAP